ncbi:MAG: YiiX/YebB-like N1pC/P60 family cysteine hydrolase [Pirellulales bacterium]
MTRAEHASQNNDVFATSCRAVDSVARQFDELKQAVIAIKGFQIVVDRGYFTPSEDEQARRLLIAYWQMRSALLEVVNDLRARAARSKADYDRLFLPGYAGALVLLDAARFLREQFHDKPLFRAKLNEPEPNFGIPAGVYDTTQQSWTRPRHAWELFDAARYHRRRINADEWKGDVDAERMLELIDRLSSRLGTRWSDFAKARVRCLTRECWSLLKRDMFGSAMWQVQKALGVLAAEKYLKLGHQPGLPDEIRKELNGKLQPGDVLLMRKEYALTNYFLPGYWPHTALYLGSEQSLRSCGLDSEPHVASRMDKCRDEHGSRSGRVMEAMKDGVHIRTMDSPYRSDSILVLRPCLHQDEIDQALSRAFFHEGKEYDFSFDFTVSTRLVCTEVIYRAYDGIGGVTFSLAPRAGRLTLAALELVNMALSNQGFRVAMTYIPTVSRQLEVDDRAVELVKHVSVPADRPAA